MSAKKILIFGFIIALIELIGGIAYLKYSPPTTAEAPKQPLTFKIPAQPTAPAVSGTPENTLTLSTTNSSPKVGETISIMVNASLPSQKSRAADLTIKYDPLFLTPVNVKTPFEKGTIYQKLVYNVIDTKNGIASMSAVTDLNNPFSGSGTLSTIQFKTLKAGSSEITIAFIKGDSRDSNLVVDGKDALSSVANLPLQINP